MEEGRKLPHVTVGIFPRNSRGEILLIRSPKWGNLLVACGGHIEYGEAVEETVIRETKEETGLTVVNPRLLGTLDMVEPPGHTKYKAHFVGLEFVADLSDDNQVVKLQADEASDHLWATPEDMVKRDDVEPLNKSVIKKYLLAKQSDTCENCERKNTDCLEYKSGWQRAVADYQNLQREMTRQRQEWATMSEWQIISEFIPVYDNLKKAFGVKEQVANGKEQNWIKGIEYIMKQFADVLKAHGVEEIKTVGEMFDPAKHEIVGEETGEGRSHTIIREVDGGYIVKGKVVKGAKVVVAA